jgi:hypothetical protein
VNWTCSTSSTCCMAVVNPQVQTTRLSDFFVIGDVLKTLRGYYLHVAGESPSQSLSPVLLLTSWRNSMLFPCSI